MSTRGKPLCGAGMVFVISVAVVAVAGSPIISFGLIGTAGTLASIPAQVPGQ